MWPFDLFNRYPTFFEGYNIDYNEPDGQCDTCGNTVYQSKESSEVLFCPNCRRLIHRKKYNYNYNYI